MGKFVIILQLRTKKHSQYIPPWGLIQNLKNRPTKSPKFSQKQKDHIKHIGELNMNYIYRYIDTTDNIIKDSK